jgi:ubiquinone/menaquinone biosynthesis C-methylase UbiE
MTNHLENNQKLWDSWTSAHEKSNFYDIEGFKAGKDRLRPIELKELGAIVEGKTLLHLQCHMGQDSLAWARRGAIVTGVDFSQQSIQVARSLNQELGLNANFVCSDVYHLPDMLNEQFDIVFTSYGVLHWLDNLDAWAKVIAHFLKPNGIFYIVEDHPIMRMFTTNPDKQSIRIANPYFFSATPDVVEAQGSYAAPDNPEHYEFYIWNHSMSEILNSLINAGLGIDYFHEFPFASRQKFPMMEVDEEGWWHFPKDFVQFPSLFSLQARKSSFSV